MLWQECENEHTNVRMNTTQLISLQLWLLQWFTHSLLTTLTWKYPLPWWWGW